MAQDRSQRVAYVIVAMISAAASAILTTLIFLLFINPALHADVSYKKADLFQLAILGLYLVTILVGGVTLWATVLGPKWITNQIEERINSSLRSKQKEETGNLLFYIGYVFGKMRGHDPGLLGDAMTHSYHAYRSLSDDHHLKLPACNNFVFYASQRPATTSWSGPVKEAMQRLRTSYNGTRDHDHALTYAAVVWRYNTYLEKRDETLHDALNLMRGLIADEWTPHIQRKKARERRKMLQALTE